MKDDKVTMPDLETPRLNVRCEKCAVRKSGKCDGMKLPMVYSLADLSREFGNHMDCDDLRMSIDNDGCFHIDIAYPYVINPESPVDLYTKEGASFWCDHLLKKPWFGWHDAEVFLKKVYKFAGINGSRITIELK